jgi:hypothetical protein
MTPLKRYNVFNNIHKGLRHMLFQTQITIQQTDFASAEADAVIAELEHVLACYDTHADHEDQFILENIIEQEPQIAAELEKDHVVDHELSAKLRAQIATWKEAANSEAKEDAAKAIFYALNSFIAFNLYHMNKEETELLPLLWKHFTDGEILEMEHRIVASIPPPVLMEESRWMMRSISNNEISDWMGGIKLGAPAPVYQMFVQMAQEELPQARFAALHIN